MKFKKYIKLVFILFASLQLQSQTFGQGNIQSVDIENLSDEQLSVYWEKAQEEGYNLEDLEILAASRGLSQNQISQLKRRVQNLPVATQSSSSDDTTDDSDSEVVRRGPDENATPFGRTASGENEEQPTSSYFGVDFFNNPNITFEPALNVATPASYELGPGDELSISVFGAAEDVFERTVGADGAIRIPNLGPIPVSGLTIRDAKIKITGRLRSIYSGISASENSPYRVGVDVSLVGIRRVQVNMIGQVKVPGTYALSALSNVMNALYAAGGPTNNGTFRNILVVRDGVVVGNFDIYKYITNGNTTGNLFLKDQDAIIVRPYEQRVVVTGEVKRAGIFEVLEGESFSDLSTFFGGFTSNAYKDKILIERIEGTQRALKEFDISGSDIVLLDGDRINVKAIADRFTNKINIEGAIYRPGNYQLDADMQLSDLFRKSLGPTESAFMERAILYRTVEGFKQEAIPFSLSAVISGDFDIKLQREDRVRVFDASTLEDDQQLTIGGAVNESQTISFIKGLTVADLIAIAGGFQNGADPDRVDVFRRINDADLATESEVVQWSGSKKLAIDPNTDFELQPFDRVIVRFLKGFGTEKNIFVRGEVAYPGQYTTINKNDRVSDIIKNAGGLTSFAYVEGATLIRQIIDGQSRAQRELLDDLTARDTIIELGSNNNEFRIALDLKKILNSKNDKYDIIVQNGDQLIIPSAKETVEIRGEILAPSLIKHDTKKSLKDYIYGSGGFSSNAKKGKVYVIKSNGEVSSTKHFLFFRNYPKVDPGSVILVPPKPERRGGLSTQEVIAITTGLGTLGLLVDRLAN